MLLESVLHDVHHDAADRVVYEAIARTWGLENVRLPRALALLDLRDDALVRLGLERGQLVSAAAAHYPCTREWAVWLHGQSVRGVAPDGIVWHSRRAELVPSERHEVFVLFGDRAPSVPGAYPLTPAGFRNLTDGPGRVTLERLAEALDARIEPAVG